MNSAVPPSATLTSPTDRVGVASSSVMVPVAVSSAAVLERAALVAPVRVTITVSSSSSRTSPFTGITMLAVVEPAGTLTLSGSGSA